MSIFKETVRVIQLIRENPNNGLAEPPENFPFFPGCMVNIVINSISKIQIGPKGLYLNWTYLNYLSLEKEGNTATFKLINEKFQMTVAWNENEEMPSFISRLITGESSNAIVGIVQYSILKPSKKKGTKKTKFNENVRIVTGSKTHFENTVTPFNYLLKNTSLSSSSSSSSSISSSSVSKIPGQKTVHSVHSLETVHRFNVVDDREMGFYTSRLVAMSEEIPNPYELASFRDLQCDNAIVENIQNVINTQANTATFCFSMGGTEINIADASHVIPRNTNQNPNLWLNDNIIHAYIEIEVQTDIPILSDIHIHPVHSSFYLYNAWRYEILEEKASTMARQTKQKNIMSTKKLSIMVINFYSTHWFLVAIYPSLKKIDILNSLPTSNGTRSVLCEILHAYLFAHSNSDPDFGQSFNISDWEICVIRTDRYPQQLNGYDCGAYTLKGIDYLIAGKQLSWSQESMQIFRTQILLALRLHNIFSLSNPGHDLQTSVLLQLTDQNFFLQESNRVNQRRNIFTESKGNNADIEAAENVAAVKEYMEGKKKIKEASLQVEGFEIFEQEINAAVYN